MKSIAFQFSSELNIKNTIKGDEYESNNLHYA